MIIESAPTLLLICLLVLLFCGLVVFALGKKLPGKGSWLVWASVFALMAGIGLEAGFFTQESFKIKVWMVGWIWSKEEIGAITLGVYQDFLSLSISGLAALISGAVLMNHEVISREPSPERAYAALAISTAGVALAWISLTPWLVFVGQVLTILGGFIALGSRWDSPNGSYLASRFVRERAFGLLLSFFGACVLATSRSALVLNQSEVWVANADNLVSTWIGSVLLVVGLFIQMQPFPFLGWIGSDSELYPPLQTVVNQIFPAWAAFSLLLRLEPQFSHLGLFPGFGWFALGSSTLAVLSGLFQKKWRLGLGSWLTAGLSLSGALLAFGGPVSAMAMVLGVSLGAIVMAATATALEGASESASPLRQRNPWLKSAVFLGASAGTGMLGFVSANGGLRWIEQATQLPGALAPFLFVLFIFVLLGWKLAWNIVRFKRGTDVSWLSILSIVILILLSTGVIWTGSVTGGVLIGHPDQIMASMFNEFFGDRAAEFANAVDFITASGLYWGSLILAFATAYWTAGRSEDRWITLSEVIPRASLFFAQGYGIDRMMSRVSLGIAWFGRAAEKLIDYKIWGDWIPRGLFSGVRTVSEKMGRLDTLLSTGLGTGLKRVVEVPAKILQLIQTGDLRWYLFFSLASGFGILLHFLRT